MGTSLKSNPNSAFSFKFDHYINSQFVCVPLCGLLDTHHHSWQQCQWRLLLYGVILSVIMCFICAAWAKTVKELCPEGSKKSTPLKPPIVYPGKTHKVLYIDSCDKNFITFSYFINFTGHYEFKLSWIVSLIKDSWLFGASDDPKLEKPLL